MALVRRIVRPFVEEAGADRVALWWQEVNNAQAAGRVSRARRFLRWILAARPDDEAAWLRLAELASSQPAQVAYLRRAYAFHPHSRRVQEALRSARAQQLEAHGGELEHRLLALCRLPGKVVRRPAAERIHVRVHSVKGSRHTTARRKPAPKNTHVSKIVTAMVCALLGMSLLPILTLPFDLGREAAVPAYGPGQDVSPPAQAPAEPGPQIVCAQETVASEPFAALVNGQGIGMQTFRRAVAELPASTAMAGVDPRDEAIRARISADRRRTLARLIDEVLIQQAAVELGVSSPETASARGDAGGCLGGSQAALEATGGSPGEDLSQDPVRQAVFDRVTATTADSLEMVRARQIVLASKQDAWHVLVRLANGEDFGRLAQETSLDRRTRGAGGDLGWLPHGLGWLAPEVEEAAFAGEPGQIRGPVHVGDGYVLLQILDHEDHRRPAPDMRRALQALDFERWLAGQRKAAHVEILVDLGAPMP